MDERKRALLFQSAMEDFRGRLPALASRKLRQLVEDGSTHPLHLSYCGLLWAMTERRFDESIALCRQAVAKDGRRQSELYLNLVRVLAMSGKRRDAIASLTEALAIHRDEPALRKELQHLVPRARPIFPSLPRKHPLNKYLGIARTVGTRLWVTVLPGRSRSSGSGLLA